MDGQIKMEELKGGSGVNLGKTMRTDNIRAHYGPGQTTVIHCSYKAAASSPLGRYAENKPLDSPNVAMQQFPQHYSHRRVAAPSKDLEIYRDLFPAGCARI